MDTIIAFPRSGEFEKAAACLTLLKLPHAVVSPHPGYSRVAAPALVCDAQGLAAIQQQHIGCAGWAAYRPASAGVPAEMPAQFAEELFGETAVMFFGPCMADETRVRLIAHLSGDLTPVLPYLNATMPRAVYNAGPSTLTFMDEQRLITLHPHKVTIGKAEELVDGWRTLERIRVLVNQTWVRRAAITPSTEMRARPPALEIYKRLPRTNCRACGEATCMAFAARLWNGQATPELCKPLFTPEYKHLRAAVFEICAGLSI